MDGETLLAPARPGPDVLAAIGQQLLDYMDSAKTGQNQFVGNALRPLIDFTVSVKIYLAQGRERGDALAEARGLKAEARERLGGKTAETMAEMRAINAAVESRVIEAGREAEKAEMEFLAGLDTNAVMRRAFAAWHELVDDRER